MKLADGQAIAQMLEVPWPTFRSWARRYPAELPQRGVKNGRRLYGIDDAEKLAEKLATRQSHEPLDKHP